MLNCMKFIENDFALFLSLPLKVRVEINPKGKFRARKLNYVQPSQVVQVPYPLKLKALTRFKYFQTREQWKVIHYFFSLFGLWRQ